MRPIRRFFVSRTGIADGLRHRRPAAAPHAAVDSPGGGPPDETALDRLRLAGLLDRRKFGGIEGRGTVSRAADGARLDPARIARGADRHIDIYMICLDIWSNEPPSACRKTCSAAPGARLPRKGAPSHP